MKKLCSRLTVMAFCVLGLSATILGVPATAAGNDDVIAAPPSQVVALGLEVEAVNGSDRASIGVHGLCASLGVWEW
jgi:hypothetical protein